MPIQRHGIPSSLNLIGSYAGKYVWSFKACLKIHTTSVFWSLFCLIFVFFSAGVQILVLVASVSTKCSIELSEKYVSEVLYVTMFLESFH